MSKDSMVELLQETLTQAEPRYTGISVACVLEDSRGNLWSGANEESEGSSHAEENAVSNKEENEEEEPSAPIVAAHIMSSREGHDGLKHALPCARCTRRLLGKSVDRRDSFGLARMEVHLYAAKGDQKHTMLLGALVQAYETWVPVSRLASDTVNTLAQASNFMQPADSVLLVGLLTELIGNFPTIETYLTGSAMGTGGARGLLNLQLQGQAYQDIDLVIVDPHEKVTAADIERCYVAALRNAGYAQKAEVLTDKYHDAKGGTSSFLDEWIGFSEFAFEMGELDYQRILLRTVKSTDTSNEPTPTAIEISLGTSLKSSMSFAYRTQGWYRRITL